MEFDTVFHLTSWITVRDRARMSDQPQGYCQEHVKLSESKYPHEVKAQILLYMPTYLIHLVMRVSTYVSRITRMRPCLVQFGRFACALKDTRVTGSKYSGCI
jgi:hypothetical protein